ncbi:phage terminase small subunit-related protein [Terribacillus goriensis]
MARPRNPKRDEAFRLWEENNGTKDLEEIGRLVNYCTLEYYNLGNLMLQ